MKQFFLAAVLLTAPAAAVKSDVRPSAVTRSDVRPSAVTMADVQSAFAKTGTMVADFEQTSATGKVARGRMQLKRPGRIRFDYGTNARNVVVADGRTLSFVDYDVAQVSQWPVRSTPLGVLLDPAADLSKVARVLPDNESPVAGAVAVLAQDPKKPEQGRILVLLAKDSSAPGGLRLSGWRVVDAQNNLTTVTLSNVRMNSQVADSAFRFVDPRSRGRAPGRPG